MSDYHRKLVPDLSGHSGSEFVSKIRIQSIDFLRGIAALIVVIVHTWPASPVNGEFWFFSLVEFVRVHIFVNGHSGVTLFFIISGYVIPFSLISHREGHLQKFFLSRVMRLYPAYWFSIVLALVVLQNSIEGRTVMANLTMVQRLFSAPDILGVYWTLFVEWIFYGFTALLFAMGLLSSTRRVSIVTGAFIVLTFVAALLRHFTELPLPAGTMMYLCLMLLGAWLRLATPGRTALFFALPAFLLIMLASSWLMYYPAKYGSAWYDEFGKFFFAVGIFSIIVYAKDISTKTMAYIGRVSYSIYLLHVPINMIIIDYILQPADYGSRVIGFIASLFGIVVFSSLTYHFVEKPFISYGRRIGKLPFFNGLRFGRSPVD